MKKIVLAALAATSAFAAMPASAQTVTGVVNVSGTVGDKCIVTNTGTPTGGAAFGGTVSLGALDDSTTGLLKASGDLATAFSNAGATQLTYRVVCTTAKTDVTVDTDELVNSAVTADPGYANTVHYDGHVALSMVGGDETVSNDSNDTPTNQVIAKRMATGATNIAVSADDFHTPNATDVMLAGTYTGKITITLAPAN
jgi:hypothetical protein